MNSAYQNYLVFRFDIANIWRQQSIYQMFFNKIDELHDKSDELHN